MDNDTLNKIVQQLNEIDNKLKNMDTIVIVDDYALLNTNKNLDELDITEQNSIKSQDNLYIIKKIKKRVAKTVNLCGIGSTVLSLGSLLF